MTANNTIVSGMWGYQTRTRVGKPFWRQAGK